MSQKIVVQVDSEIKELIPGYLENRKNEVKELRKLCKEMNADAIAKISHKLKGNAGGYGFTKLGELAKALEDAVKNGMWKDVSQSIEDMDHYLSHIKVQYVEDKT